MPLRRVVAAALLDVSVRQGDPYAAPLAAAKSLAANPDALKPLDSFAATGVPHPAALSRELLALVPKLSPRAEEDSAAGSGLVDRLQAGAAKLVRIERTDQAGNDRGAIVARATAAALRNDFAVARRELNMLAPADRAAAQPPRAERRLGQGQGRSAATRVRRAGEPGGRRLPRGTVARSRRHVRLPLRDVAGGARRAARGSATLCASQRRKTWLKLISSRRSTSRSPMSSRTIRPSSSWARTSA